MLPLKIQSDHLPVRTLAESALDNATEGCVMEAFAAMEAVHQGQHASTPRLRAHFAAVAEDELDHAALSLACHEYFMARLSPVVAADIDAAREATRARLLRALPNNDVESRGTHVESRGTHVGAESPRAKGGPELTEGSARAQGRLEHRVEALGYIWPAVHRSITNSSAASGSRFVNVA